MTIFIRYNEGLAVLVAGGYCSQCRATSEIFVINENRWTSGPSVTVPGGRTGFSYGGTYNIDDETVVFVGGYDANDKQERGIFKFDGLSGFTQLDGSLSAGIYPYDFTMTSFVDGQSC